ncbi:putative P-type ATPase [Betaentomopoxvirus amoorei]|uniref:AMV082 n=1 Tax=Amsacta moorei entomopoxvirus TaxID=28321 RepID=Q9EMW7_AMEPV|nr:putative P-type ATPase [Amsacta moorei entomopoxvirus]AAG02788.1 AMV082 [Amsacta moorei entomopoxvirus]
MDNCDLINSINNIQNNIYMLKNDLNKIQNYNKWKNEINDIIKFLNKNKEKIILYSYNNNIYN